jgi:hypothetical protein
LAHEDDHDCGCEFIRGWEKDTNFEVACLLYVAHWTTQDALGRRIAPTRKTVEAACRPLDSDWREKALIAETYLRKKETHEAR